MYKSRHEQSGEDFFLASRGLLWPFIGLIFMIILTVVRPLSEPVTMSAREGFDAKPDNKIVGMGITVVVLNLLLYAIFW